MGNLFLTRKHNLPISFAFDLAHLGFEAWMVIGLRTTKLAMGGPAAMLEAQRMVAEKTAAMLEGQAAAGMAVAIGSSKAGRGPKGDRAISPSREGKSSQAHTQAVSRAAAIRRARAGLAGSEQFRSSSKDLASAR